LQQQGLSKLPVQWRIYVKDIAALLGIEKTVSAVVSARVDTPQVIGFLKPIILVPLACIKPVEHPTGGSGAPARAHSHQTQ